MPDLPASKPRNPSRVLYILLLVFTAPFALSWWMYNFTQLGRDGGAYSHGDLIIPPRPVREMTLFDPSAGMRERHLHGRWNLIYLADRECGRKCEQQLYVMRQLWIAMGRDSDRLQRVLMIFNAPDKSSAASWAQQYPGQLMALINEADSATMAGHFSLAADDSPLAAGRLYIIDPRGNLMMSYPSGTNPSGIIKDLQRLFKYSNIG